jgi:cytosine/uracil/thiamine/allantoin permease
MEILLAYHRHTVEGLILVMILNIALPHLLKSNFPKMVLYSRIGFFLFWTLWSMVVFTGVVTLVFTKMHLSMSVWLMIALATILPILDGYRAVKVTKDYWLNGESGIKFSNIVVGVELTLTVAMMITALL